jgi:hypothetical protein
MKAIPTWRATSRDEEAIRQIAAVYGGEPRPWEGSDGQWEVITTAAELNVVLPPDPLGGTPIYEQWSGGGCQRRCDGVKCQVPTAGPDGTELAEVDCICSAKGAMECSPHTRLSVILPDVRFAGVWRYESATSWIVAQELPGMVELVRGLQERGLTRAVLAIEKRRRTQDRKPFTIPVIRLADSPDEIAAGHAALGALPVAAVEPPVPALAAAPASPEEWAEDDEPVGWPITHDASGRRRDDEVIDAVIVDDVAPERVLEAAQRAGMRTLSPVCRPAGLARRGDDLMADHYRDHMVSYVASDGALMLVFRDNDEPTEVIRIPDPRFHEQALDIFRRRTTCASVIDGLKRAKIKRQRRSVAYAMWDGGDRRAA